MADEGREADDLEDFRELEMARGWHEEEQWTKSGKLQGSRSIIGRRVKGRGRQVSQEEREMEGDVSNNWRRSDVKTAEWSVGRRAGWYEKSNSPTAETDLEMRIFEKVELESDGE